MSNRDVFFGENINMYYAYEFYKVTRLLGRFVLIFYFNF